MYRVEHQNIVSIGSIWVKLPTLVVFWKIMLRRSGQPIARSVIYQDKIGIHLVVSIMWEGIIH